MNGSGPLRSTRAVVATLGTTQTIAWASSYYLPAVLADSMARELAVPPSLVFAAFSAALLVSGALGPMAGRLIDRHGGRAVLVASNGILAVGLLALAAAQGPLTLFAAWLLVGIGIAAGLYDAAFATLVGLFRERSRSAITGITLIAGFASTIGWPVSALIEGAWGWRAVCVFWAGLHVFVCLPANRWLLPSSGASGDGAQAGARPPPPSVSADPVPALAARTASSVLPGADPELAAARHRRTTVLLLGFVFAAAGFVAGAMGTQMLRLLEAGGATPAAAIAAGMLLGPAQVVARLLEFSLARRVTPLNSARAAFALHPLGAAGLLAFGAPAAAPFAMLHGASNGLVTIARGTLPLWLFGAQGYGALLGRFGGLARIAQAIAPFAFGLAIDGLGSSAVLITSGLMAAAVLALLLIRPVPGHPSKAVP